MLAERGAAATATSCRCPRRSSGIIAARLDTLRPEEKAVLQDASVVGRMFWLGAVEHLGNDPRWTVEERLRSLERKQFVRRQRRSTVEGETEYSFRHLLVRDVAYGRIPRARRAEKHRLAAEWIESLGRPEAHAETFAYHYSQALELRPRLGTRRRPRRAGTARARRGGRPCDGAQELRGGGPLLRRRARALARGRPRLAALLFRHGKAVF